MPTKPSIAIMGIRGSFSEEAAAVFLHNHGQVAKLIYATTAAKTFDTVKQAKASMGLVALENSNGGLVMETVRAMADYKFRILDIFEIDVQQNLIGLKSVREADVQKIISHPQALAQCKFYLRRQWPKAELAEYDDTALAARDLSAGKFGKQTAVIASSQAARIFDLKILEPSIQDLKFNFTSFMAFDQVS